MKNSIKSLNELANEINFYTYKAIPKNWVNSDWCKSYIEKDSTKEILSNTPDLLLNSNQIEIGVFYECKTQYKNHFGDGPDPKIVELYHMNGPTLFLKSKNSNIILRLRTNKNKSSLFPDYSILGKYYKISHDTKKKGLSALKEPNLVGVWTEKKLTDWIGYNEQYISVMDNLLNENGQKNDELEKEIQDTINSLNGCKVSKWQNVTEIETESFVIKYTHYKDSAHLQSEVRFKGGVKNAIRLHQATTS